MLVLPLWLFSRDPSWAASALGDSSYLNPAGWADQHREGTHTLIPPVVRQGEFLALLIFAPRPASSNPSADLMAFADQAEQQGRRLERGGIERRRVGQATLYFMAARADLPGLGPHSRIYEIVTEGTRSVLATAVYRGDATFTANEATLRKIMTSVRPGAEALAQQAAPPENVQTGGGIPYGPSKALVTDKDFRPSGHGVTIPPAALNNGVPVGLWWNVHISTNLSGATSWNSPFVRAAGGGSIYSTVFLTDGTVVRFFRPGGPNLVDIQGMRALGDSPYIGDYSVSSGVMTAAYGEFRISKPIKVGGSSEQPYFVWNAEEYHPASPLTPHFLLGTWRWGASGTIAFRADGTVVTTPPVIDAQWTHTSNTEPLVGTWVLDGYLLALRFPTDGSRVYVVFRDNNGGLVVNQSLLSRE
jgi:hypothetical protein